MKPHVQKSVWLAGILGLLLLVDVGAMWVEPGAADSLPEAPVVAFKDLTKLRIAQKAGAIEFERQEDDWRMVAPFSAPADRDALNGIRRLLSRGIKLELQIEENSEDLAAFGLEPGTLVEAYTDSEQPDIALYVGRNTSGGASFVRFPDDKTVYRAFVGGAQRYTKPAPAWRDPVVSRLDDKTVTGLILKAPSHSLQFTREGEAGPWRFNDDPSFPVDQEEVARLVTALSGLRAGAVLSPDHPAGLEQPVATVQIERPNSDPITLVFGRTLAGAFVKNAGKEEIYQIAPSFTERLTHPKEAWYNRIVLDIARTEIHRMSLTEQNVGTTILEQDPATNRWTVIQPANVDANLRDCMQAAIALSSLRAFAMSALKPEQVGFPSPNFIDVELLNGEKYRLELGRQVPGMPKGKEALFVRTTDTPDRIAVVPIRTIIGIRTAFSR